MDIERKDLVVSEWSEKSRSSCISSSVSGVRLTHIPTGIEVTADSKLSRHGNYNVALHLLKIKIG